MSCKRLCCILAALWTFLLAGCAAKAPAEMTIFAMDTYMTLLAYGDEAEKALYDAAKNIQAIEKDISRTRENSDVSALNNGKCVSVSEYTLALLWDAISYAGETGGLFDPTVAPLVALWNITGETPHVAQDDEIAALLPLVGTQHIHRDGAVFSLDPGCAIDLGGIGKGYASDIVANTLRQYGVESATISLGGNVYVHGAKPDGKPWSVAIQDPHGNGYACTVSLTDCFIVTSGGYQRYFTAPDGTVYQHILDPRNGRPAVSDLASVSVICGSDGSGARADAFSTALYVMGEHDAIDFWRKKGDFEMVAITNDGRLLYTPGLADKISASEGSPYELQCIC